MSQEPQAMAGLTGVGIASFGAPRKETVNIPVTWGGEEPPTALAGAYLLLGLLCQTSA